MHLRAHTRTRQQAHTHQIHQTAATREGGKTRERERETGRRRVDKRQTDKHPYLFVHFDVEAIRHLVVLRTERWAELVKGILNL